MDIKDYNKAQKQLQSFIGSKLKGFDETEIISIQYLNENLKEIDSVETTDEGEVLFCRHQNIDELKKRLKQQKNSP